MAGAPDWLTDEAIEPTYGLGREMAEFLLRCNQAKSLDPDAKVEPHPELLVQIQAARARYKQRARPGSDVSP